MLAAKITGITPGHVHAQRQVGLAALCHAPADHALGVLHGDPPLALLHEHDPGDDREHEERHHHLEDLVLGRPPGLDAGGQARDDRGEDQQRDAVADAALGDQLADPHQQHAAGRQADDDQEDVGRVEVGDDRFAGFGLQRVEQEHVADRLREREPDRQVAGVLGDASLADLAFLGELFQRRHDHLQQLQDDRGGDVGHDPEREQRDPRQAAAGEQVQVAEDPRAAELLLDVVDGREVDARHGHVRAEAVDQEHRRGEAELLADVRYLERVEDRGEHELGCGHAPRDT